MSTCLQKWQSNTRAMPREELKRVHGPVAAGNRRERFQKSVSYIYIYKIRELGDQSSEK